MNLERASYAFGQFVIAVFKLGSGTENLGLRLRSACDGLRENVTGADLPDVLQGPYEDILRVDLDALEEREQVALASKIMSFTFALLELVSKWEMTKETEPPSRDFLLAARFLSLDGSAPIPQSEEH